MKIAVFWNVVPCSLVEVTNVLKAASTSETLVNFYQTTRYNIPEDSYLQVKTIFLFLLLLLLL
jgi:phage tail sheath gpL-like